ncbi:MAG: hypothetical protein IT376_14235 [Polyangiaceae bacterium]|nr:hypothetical protein [Polyangiaceae bacterium]
MPSRLPHHLAIATVITAAAGGCLATLDESLIPDGDADASAGGTSGGAGAAGASGAGGAGAGGASGAGPDAASDAPADAPPDAPLPPVFVPYDSGVHPVKNLANLPSEVPLLISTDAADVFRTTRGSSAALLGKVPLAGGAGVPVSAGVELPFAMATPPGSIFVYLAAGKVSTQEGRIRRITKSDGTPIEIAPPGPIGEGRGIFAAADGNVYVSLRVVGAGSIGLVRFPQAAGGTTATTVYTSQAGNETGGDLTVSGGCVYWISNGGVWVTRTDGGSSRAEALADPIDDAVGIASDNLNFYVSRSSGEIWQRKLSSNSCDGQGEAERRIAARIGANEFVNVGDVVTYAGTVTWSARGGAAPDYLGGGVFMTPIGGGDVTQIAPAEGGVEALDHGPTVVVFATSSGLIRSVPKTPP